MRIYLLFFFVISVGSILASANKIALAQEPFVLTAHTTNRVTVVTYGSSPFIEISPTPLERKATGAESSQCKDYGRKSSSVARAGAHVLSSTPTAITLALQGTALAEGGHYRTCAQCVLGNCVGISGNDTQARAEAFSNARIMLQFNNELLYNDYDLKIVSAGDKTAFSVLLTSPTGTVTDLGASGSGTYKISAKAGDVYFVDLKLDLAVTNTGGCCSDKKDGSIQVSLRLDKAPILSGLKDVEPFIVGGEPTEGHKNVVAILLDGQLHCSGTVIGTATILTAAHCVFAHEQEIESGRMSYVIAKLGSRLIKSTIQEPQPGRQMRGSFAPVCRIGLRCA